MLRVTAATAGVVVVLDRDGLVTYDPSFLEPAFAERALEGLATEAAWKQESIRMFGRLVPVPRLTAWHGDPGTTFTYSGLTNVPAPWTPLLSELRDRVCAAAQVPFNSVLLNRYRSGDDGMGWHADDEPELGDVIGSVSLGATRTFRFKHRVDGERREVALANGSLLVMSGDSQRCWLHAVPKQTRVRGPRINLTFRVVRPR
ncbi:MAG: alpha-ketoglutarate-dependent dioxygenase AlkB [Candidatus Elarobacter sp.]